MLLPSCKVPTCTLQKGTPILLPGWESVKLDLKIAAVSWMVAVKLDLVFAAVSWIAAANLDVIAELDLSFTLSATVLLFPTKLWHMKTLPLP